MRVNILYIVATLFAIAFNNSAYAQKAVVLNVSDTQDGASASTSTYVVLDNSNLPNFYTKKERDLQKINGQLKRHTESKAYSAGGANSFPANSRVSRKFAISPNDVWSDGRTESSIESGVQNTQTHSWHIASGFPASTNDVNKDSDFIPTLNATSGSCWNYQGANGKDKKGTWRLPTQTELQLIWTMNTKINSISKDNSGFVPFSKSIHWSATEIYSGHTSSSCWFVHFNNGTVNTNTNKTVNFDVRCIRDL